jgi:5-methylcytosine-specific restriction endonuclease McrA
MRLCPLGAISQELVRFDTQALERPDIEGVQYQQGTLAGYEVRAYVLLKWNHQCAYCDARQVPLELDHLHPRSKLGSNRVSNLVAACKPCNQRKGNQDIREFLKEQPHRLARILAQTKAPLRDAAAVNATRWALYERLKELELPVECGSGGLTKFNRITRNVPKTHWCDAVCVGRSTPESLIIENVVPLHITATGHGSRRMCLMNEHGFPRTRPKGAKRVRGFQTGDLVRAVVTSGSKQGTYVGKVAVRTRGVFNIKTVQGTVTDIHYRFCTLLVRSDGYTYHFRKETALPPAA